MTAVRWNGVRRRHGRIGVAKPIQREHRMMLARPSPQAAKRYRLNPNHHIRVWCTCMEQAVSEPGTWRGQHAETTDQNRTARQSDADPRRLGAYDWLGVVDVRDEGAALRLWREHVACQNHNYA